MSAVLQPRVDIRPMSPDDLDAVMAIENSVHTHPWSRANFTDSLSSGYSCWICRLDGELVGYFVLMLALDEAHLLTIGVAERRQRQGFGARLLHQAMEAARQAGAISLLLEVRPSNLAALSLYRHFGFRQIGLRRAYYAGVDGREDALVLMRALEEVRA